MTHGAPGDAPGRGGAGASGVSVHPDADQEPFDAPTIQRAAQGDRLAFNQLVVRYQDAVYSLCFRLSGNADDAADATQEAFIAAYRHLGELRGSSFKSWLFRIAANACFNLHRQRRRRPADSLDREDELGTPPEAQDASPGPEHLVLRQELGAAVQRGLLALPEDQRLALVLCDLHGYDYAAIAELTGVELGTVKSRINRGRRRLRDLLLADPSNRELLPPRERLTQDRDTPE